MRSLISFFAVLGVCWATAQVPGGGLHVEPVQSVDSQIIGGVSAGPGAFPSILSLQLNGVHHCGATVIKADYGLTSAQCVINQDAGSLRVVAGQYDRNDYTGTQTVGIANYNIHELFNNGPGGVGEADYANDIAILRFTTPIFVVPGRIEFAELARDSDNLFAGVVCSIAGWGRVDTTSGYPVTLQWASIPVITDPQCEAELPGFQVWLDQICAQDSVQGACDGDFGGPLLCQDPTYGLVIAGVGSWVVKDETTGACLALYPSVYTRVSSYHIWIETNTPTP